MTPMSVLAGLSAGWLADTWVIRRGHGLIVDMGLGVGASLVGSSVLLALYGPSAGMLGMLVVGFFLATSVILAQRLSWPSAPGAREGERRDFASSSWAAASGSRYPRRDYSRSGTAG